LDRGEKEKELEWARIAVSVGAMRTNSPDHLTEIAALLAAGLLRLQSRKSSRNLLVAGDSSLDCEVNSRGDVAAESENSRP
jgi:hypothetical protein